jgi:hypothetical protein
MEHVILIEGGAARFVYDDELIDLLDLGDAAVRRASHVEPDPDGGWLADMAPSSGPVLHGYRTRAEALEAERAWLRAHRGL